MKILLFLFTILFLFACSSEEYTKRSYDIQSFDLYNADDTLVVSLALCMTNPTVRVDSDGDYELLADQMANCNTAAFADSQIFDFGALSGNSVSSTDVFLSGHLPASNGVTVFHNFEFDSDSFEIGEGLSDGKYIYIKAKLNEN